MAGAPRGAYAICGKTCPRISLALNPGYGLPSIAHAPRAPQGCLICRGFLESSITRAIFSKPDAEIAAVGSESAPRLERGMDDHGSSDSRVWRNLKAPSLAEFELLADSTF